MTCGTMSVTGHVWRSAPNCQLKKNLTTYYNSVYLENFSVWLVHIWRTWSHTILPGGNPNMSKLVKSQKYKNEGLSRLKRDVLMSKYLKS